MFLWPLKKKADKADKDYFFGKSEDDDLNYLLKQCRNNLPKVDEQLIRKAFHWCVNAHKNKIRKSGEPYYTHPLAVAHIVISEIPLDDISVASALLHNAFDVRDSNGGTKAIQSEFGTTIAEIVDAIVKIQHIEGHNIKQSENYRKLLLSLFKDVRIIFIKIADRLHNMRTLEYLSPEKQQKLAEETMEIYVPFANRFGLGNLKWELEDLSFKYLNRIAYDDIRRSLQLTRSEREDYIKDFITKIEERLKSDDFFIKKNIKFDITGRVKHIYSIYNKMKIRHLPLEELYDLLALRIIIDTEDSSSCFIVYGIISDIFQPIPGTFKNYISKPKKNGYQSIHAAFNGTDSRSFEVQIRTRHMHEVAERGVASHFNYKRGFLPAQSVLDDKNFEEWLDLVRNVFEHIGTESRDLLLESVKRNLINDEIYVFTPTNEFRIFPKDATPLDFAYSIHTEIGEHCIGAKVNGKIVPLDYKMQSGDQIEILTSKKQKPNKDWLKYVVTQRAKSYIQKYLKDKTSRELDDGYRIWEDIIKRMNVNLSSEEFKNLLKELKYENPESFYQALASAGLDESMIEELISDIIKNMKSISEKIQVDEEKEKFIPMLKPNNRNGINSSDKVELCRLCNPIPGDIIYGEVTVSKVILVHRNTCKKIQELLETRNSSLFNIDWTAISSKNYIAKIRIVGNESPNILSNITNKLSQLGNINIQGFKFDSYETGFVGILTINFIKIEDLNSVFNSLRTLEGIKSVERYME